MILKIFFTWIGKQNRAVKSAKNFRRISEFTQPEEQIIVRHG